MNLFAKIYLILTLDCEQSAKLTSDSMDRELDRSERLAAFLHRLICSKSRRLHSQLVALNRELVQSVTQFNRLPDLSDEARLRMQKKLRR